MGLFWFYNYPADNHPPPLQRAEIRANLQKLPTSTICTDILQQEQHKVRSFLASYIRPKIYSALQYPFGEPGEPLIGEVFRRSNHIGEPRRRALVYSTVFTHHQGYICMGSLLGNGLIWSVAPIKGLSTGRLGSIRFVVQRNYSFFWSLKKWNCISSQCNAGIFLACFLK